MDDDRTDAGAFPPMRRGAASAIVVASLSEDDNK